MIEPKICYGPSLVNVQPKENLLKLDVNPRLLLMGFVCSFPYNPKKEYEQFSGMTSLSLQNKEQKLSKKTNLENIMLPRGGGGGAVLGKDRTTKLSKPH